MNRSTPTSGFLSQEDECEGPAEETEEVEDPNSDDSDQSSTTSTLTSFREFIENHVEPYAKDYDELATSYLCMDFPCPKITCEDSKSYQDIEIKFKDPVILQKFLKQEFARAQLGPSIRKGLLIPSAKWIWNDWWCAKGTFETREERLQYLYAKARQWCEVNKALSMDIKYPKPDPNVFRKRYSQAHQKVSRMVRKEQGLKRDDPMVRFQIPRMQDFRRKSVFLPTMEGELLGEAGRSDEVREKWEDWEKTVGKVFEDIKPLPELPSKLQHWQMKARESSRMRLKPKGKRHWRRNVYPLQTLEDYIASKRKLLPPLKPEHQQTDYLSGIWIPELMVGEFEITPLNYDSRVAVEARDGADPISWWVVHEATQKCWQWLRSNPPNL